MDTRRRPPGHLGESEAKGTTDRQPSPLAFALDRLFPKRGGALYATSERVVVLVIIRAMSFDAPVGEFNCFLSYPTIARWSGLSLASVKRALTKHVDGPAPLIVRSKPGHTRGYAHACYRFTLVRAPEACARARDVTRAAHHEHAQQALRDLQPDRIALQLQRQEFGGALTEVEYKRRLAILEDTVRRRIPVRAQPKRSVSS
jgi:hypothetical protein